MPTNNRTITTITDVVDDMNSNLQSLEQGQKYTLEELVGKENWLSIPKGLRNRLGQAFKALATNGSLPVSYADDTSSHKAQYELK